jgi:hypothetical protein
VEERENRREKAVGANAIALSSSTGNDVSPENQPSVLDFAQ